jgi:hypothetical protein
MKSIQAKYVVLAGGGGILLASFMAMATTSNGLYVSISHMSALLYLLPILGVLAMASGVLKPTAQINMSLASMCIGGLALILSLYAGNQAEDQLNAFAQMNHELQVRRAQFESDFNSGWKQFDKNFTTQRDDIRETNPSEQKPEPATTEEAKPITIPEPEKASFGMGFYLAILSSITVIVAGRLMRKQESATEKNSK